MPKRIIYLGFRIDESRPEAVAINTGLYRQATIELGWQCDVLAYDGSATSLGKLRRYLRRIGDFCRAHRGVIVHDFFAMPGVSLIVQAYLRMAGVRPGYVKTFINPAGTGDVTSYVGLLRLGLNNSAINRMVAVFSDAVTYIVPLRYPRFRRLAVPLRFPPTAPVHHDGPMRVGYLGHALKLKGVHLLPGIVRAVNRLRGGGAKFHFSFSDGGDVTGLRRELAELPGCTVEGVTDPGEFFAKQDVYLLPIPNAFAASGSFNTIWEAMSTGCCVVTPDLADLPQILDKGNAQLLGGKNVEDWAEALVGLIDEPPRLAQKREEAHQAYLRIYEREKTAVSCQLRGIYEQVGR